MPQFVILVCGGRKFNDREMFAQVMGHLKRCKEAFRVVQGGATGADFLARLWCKNNKVPCRTYRAKWKLYGYGAGPIRNQEMVDKEPIHLGIAFPGNTGTSDMVKRLLKAEIPVIRVRHLTSDNVVTELLLPRQTQ